MIDDLYVKFFPRDIEDISLIANKILENIPEDEYYKKFNEYMRLQEVELRSIIRKKRKLGKKKFGMFLTDLLNELFAAKQYQESHRDLFSSDKKLSTVFLVLKNFNNKVLSALKIRYGREYCSHFETPLTSSNKSTTVEIKQYDEMQNRRSIFKSTTTREWFVNALSDLGWNDPKTHGFEAKIFCFMDLKRCKEAIFISGITKNNFANFLNEYFNEECIKIKSKYSDSELHHKTLKDYITNYPMPSNKIE